MLDVRRLQVLRSVVATGSVGGAAQALGYTPSSISQQISLLQREVGEVDLALTVAELSVPADGVTWTHLLDDPFDVVLPADHPLTEEAEIALPDLAEIPWVTHEWPLGMCSRRVLEACSAAGFTPHYRVECNDVDTAQGLVAAGLGIGVMPRLGLVRAHPDVVIRARRRHVPGPGSDTVDSLRDRA